MYTAHSLLGSVNGSESNPTCNPEKLLPHNEVGDQEYLGGACHIQDVVVESLPLQGDIAVCVSGGTS